MRFFISGGIRQIPDKLVEIAIMVALFHEHPNHSQAFIISLVYQVDLHWGMFSIYRMFAGCMKMELFEMIIFAGICYETSFLWGNLYRMAIVDQLFHV